MIIEFGTGLSPYLLNQTPPESFPFFKSPCIDDNKILHWFAYISDETFSFREVPIELWIEEAAKEFMQFAGRNDLIITEPILNHKHLIEFSFTEIHAKAGIIK